MNGMNLQLKLSLLLSVLFYQCNSFDMMDTKGNIIYYKDFDIFNLKGIDTLKKINKNQSVEVQYDKGMPIYIKYYKPQRTVTLILEDSFNIDDTPVYVYTTSNFHGGPPGRHKLYTGHYVEYKDLVYVSFSDTLICETKDVPPTQNYRFDLYVKKYGDGIIKTSKGEYDYHRENAKLPRQQLYLKWFDILQKEYKGDTASPIIIKEIPQ
jgi:hypothetical protein